MQEHHEAAWEPTFASALERSGEHLDPEALAQWREFTRDPDRRFRSHDLLGLARKHDPSFSARLLSDWPTWGLLALAEKRGRGPGHGVDRSWSGPQTLVFLAVARGRARGFRRRSELANIVVFHWLLLGTEYVPLLQVRRALATWGSAARTISAQRFQADLYQHVRRHPEVQAGVDSGDLSRTELSRRISPTLSSDQRDEAASLVSRLTAAPGSDDTASKERVERQRGAWEAIDRGLAALQGASDEALLRTRELYLRHNLVEPQDRLRQAGAATILQHFKNEAETAAANAVSYLANAIDEAESAAILNYVQQGTQASLGLSKFLGTAGIAETRARESIERSWNRRAKRMSKRSRT
jgi:hypothetical protein